MPQRSCTLTHRLPGCRCLYHHVYPVGYRATKVHFKAIIEMTIEQDTFGPLFKVRGACSLWFG